MIELVQIDVPSSAASRRALLVANALAVVGVGAVVERAVFEALLGAPPQGGWDLDRPFHYDASTGATTGLSTCGLVARGLLARSGVRIPSWGRPYVSGTVFTELEQLGYDTGARRGPGGGAVPGDVFVIGAGLMTHMALLVAGNTDSVDGGQVDANNLQCIKRVSRAFIQAQWLDEIALSPELEAPGAATDWSLNVDRLSWGPTAMAPVGFEPGVSLGKGLAIGCAAGVGAWGLYELVKWLLRRRS